MARKSHPKRQLRKRSSMPNCMAGASMSAGVTHGVRYNAPITMMNAVAANSA